MEHKKFDYGGLKPKCPECAETLYSHAGRFWKYFHNHVIDGPYPNPEPHRCSLVNAQFNSDGTKVVYEVLIRELKEHQMRIDNQFCVCAHRRKEHGAPESVNFPFAGHCRGCECGEFVYAHPTTIEIK